MTVVVVVVVVVIIASTSSYQSSMLGKIEGRGDGFGGGDPSLQDIVTLMEWKALVGCVDVSNRMCG